jgi:hypothetical protein
MRDYRQPLSKRRYDSAYHTNRYWTDPEYRVRKINRERVRLGRPTISSVDEIMTTWSRKPVERA